MLQYVKEDKENKKNKKKRPICLVLGLLPHPILCFLKSWQKCVKLIHFQIATAPTKAFPKGCRSADMMCCVSQLFQRACPSSLVTTVF